MSVNKLARTQGKILDDIMKYCHENLDKVMEDVTLEDLRAFAFIAGPTQDITKIFTPSKMVIIGEGKKATPTRGMIDNRYDPIAMTKAYANLGVRAVAIWTDRRHYQGNLTHLRDVRESLTEKCPPLIRYDFIFDPYQIYESRVAGADAVILIMTVIGGKKKLQELMVLCQRLKMTPLVEVHTPEELQQVLPLNPPVIIINNRQWQTFDVDLKTTANLRPLIPAGIPVVSSGGIKTVQDLEFLQRVGVDGVMVGEAFIRHQNVPDIVRTFVEAGRKKA